MRWVMLGLLLLLTFGLTAYLTGVRVAPVPQPVAADEFVQGAPLDAPPPIPASLPSLTPLNDPRTGQVVDGFLILSFDQLAGFEYWPYPEESSANVDSAPPPQEVPESILALNGKQVAVTGFIIPLEVVEGKITSFLLVANQMACCFGVPLTPNEWIEVALESSSHAVVYKDVPLTVRGTLEVGEKKSADGWVLSLYRMKAIAVTARDGF